MTFSFRSHICNYFLENFLWWRMIIINYYINTKIYDELHLYVDCKNILLHMWPSAWRLQVSSLFFIIVACKLHMSANIFLQYHSSEIRGLSWWNDVAKCFKICHILKPLFRKKRFFLNKMFQRNASKFAIFYV